jgi:predicted kinase
MPTLYLTCGLPGSGKTTLARRLEQEAPALRLTGDEWMHGLYAGISTEEAETGPCRSRVERPQWAVALRALELGCNVVVDWGGDAAPARPPHLTTQGSRAASLRRF